MKKALVVIDPQNIYTDKDSEMFCKDSKNTVAKINDLIAAFDAAKMAIVFVRHIHKTDGSDLGRMFDYAGDEEPEFNFKEDSKEVEYDSRINIPKAAAHFIKNRYSAFTNPNFVKHLRDLGVDGIVICGFMTNFCCDSTCRDAHDADYFVDFVLDATGTPGTDKMSESEIRKVVGELLGSGYCVVHSMKNFLKSMKA